MGVGMICISAVHKNATYHIFYAKHKEEHAVPSGLNYSSHGYERCDKGDLLIIWYFEIRAILCVISANNVAFAFERSVALAHDKRTEGFPMTFLHVKCKKKNSFDAAFSENSSFPAMLIKRVFQCCVSDTQTNTDFQNIHLHNT